MTDGLKSEHRRAIIETLSANPKVERIVLFGSRAMGTFTPTSDIDLALYGDDLTLSDQAALAEAMAELSIPQRVDILIHHRIENRALREHIRKHGVEWFMRRRAAGTAAMAGEWPIVPVSELAKAVIGGTPSRNVAEYWHGNIPWATAKDVATVSARYLENVEEYISREALENSAAKLLPYGTVVITARGTVGAMAQLGREMAFNQTCYALLPKGGVDKDFLFYALKGTIAEMRSLTYGTVFETITTKTFDHWLVPLPPLPEQRAIAHILGTLDDKIELNRRMSKTLEAMARALFKAWFVDFEPVRAKMEGRWQRGQSLPGLPAHLYDLFPDRLVDSELGEIPEGWRVVRLGDLISFEKGRKPPVSYPLPCKGYLPVVLIENFNGIVSSYALPKGMTIAQEKDVLMVMDGASSGRVETGHYGIVGSTLAKITLREGSGVGTHFLYYALKLLEPEIREHLTGTSIPHADKNWISAQMVCFPNKGELLFYFEEIVGQIRERIRALRGESRTLAALRDVLLPKLIRGEIRVKEAERFVQDFGGERR